MCMSLFRAQKVPAGFQALTKGVSVFGPISNTGLGFAEIVALSGFLELAWQEDKDREPGNFGNPLGIPMYNDEMRCP